MIKSYYYTFILMLFCSVAVSAHDKTRTAGTGFVINSNGFIATCYHVVAETNAISVVVYDSQGISQTVPAAVFAVDSNSDLAILKIQNQNLTPLTINPARVQIGQEALVIGYPLLDALGQTVKMSRGMVSGFVSDSLQVDAPINPGNSGGPLLNNHGNVVAVASAKLSGPEVSNVGICIPSAKLIRLMELNGLTPAKVPEKNPEQTPAAIFKQSSPSVVLILVEKVDSVNSQNNLSGNSNVKPGKSKPIDFSIYTDGAITVGNQIVVPPDKVHKVDLLPGQTWLGPRLYTKRSYYAQSQKSVPVAFGPDAVKAQNQVRDQFKSELAAAKTEAQKSTLADKIALTGRTESDPAKQFALYNFARLLAAQSGNIKQTRLIVEAMLDNWTFDPYTAEISSLMDVGKHISTSQQWLQLGFWAIDLQIQANNKNDSVNSERLRKIVEVAMKKSPDGGKILTAKLIKPGCNTVPDEMANLNVMLPTSSQLNPQTRNIFDYIASMVNNQSVVRSPMAGNTFNGTAVDSILPQGGMMIGLEITFNQSKGVSSVTPLYKSMVNNRQDFIRGTTIGYPGLAPSQVIARNGYALSGLRIVGSEELEGCGGIQLQFSKICQQGLLIDDTYPSYFVGRGDSSSSSTFIGNGGIIVGLQGRISDPDLHQLLGLGVIVVPQGD